MAQATHGVGGLKYDTSKRAWPPELNVFVALLLIVATFEILGRLIIGDSFLFNTRDNVDTLFNEPRLTIIILQVSIVGIIAIGVTQVIITGGIDLSSGSIVGATAMIAMSFAQVSIVNGNPNPKAIFPGARLARPAGHRADTGRPGLRAHCRPDQRIADRLHAAFRPSSPRSA